MFVVLLTYVRPVEEIDQLLDEHVAWLERHYAAARFLASGRRVPRTGGVLLARGLDRGELDAVLSEDPFVRNGVAGYEVVEFEVTMTAPSALGLQET